MTNKDTDHRKVANHVLATANTIVTTERGNQHGGAEDSFQMIAEFWTTYLNNTVLNRQTTATPDVGKLTVTAKDVAQMMVLLKIARHIHGDPKNADNFYDAAGYTALAAALAGIQAPPPAVQQPAAAPPAPRREPTAAEMAAKYAPLTTNSKVVEGGGELAKKEPDPLDAMVRELATEVQK